MLFELMSFADIIADNKRFISRFHAFADAVSAATYVTYYLQRLMLSSQGRTAARVLSRDAAYRHSHTG